jgi:hypothetical protein
VIAAYVWDFAAGRATSWPLTRGMCQIGMELPKVPGSEASSIETLRSLFERAGFETVTTRPIRRLIEHSRVSKISGIPKSRPSPRMARPSRPYERPTAPNWLKQSGQILLDHPDGSVTYSTRANAVRSSPCVMSRDQAQIDRPALRREIRSQSSSRTGRYWYSRSHIRQAPCRSPSGRAFASIRRRLSV